MISPALADGGPLFSQATCAGMTIEVRAVQPTAATPSAETLATLRIGFAAGQAGTWNFTFTGEASSSPGPRVPREQGKLWHGPLTETRVRPFGVGSFSTTPAAAVSPWLATSIS